MVASSCRVMEMGPQDSTHSPRQGTGGIPEYSSASDSIGGGTMGPRLGRAGRGTDWVSGHAAAIDPGVTSSFPSRRRPPRLKYVNPGADNHRVAADSSIGEVARLWHIIETQRLMDSASLGHQELMNVVIQRAQALTEADGGVVEVVEADEMVQAGASGITAGGLGRRLPVATSLSGRCGRLGIPLRCPDAATDSRVDREEAVPFAIRSMVVVPVLQRHDSVAVLKVVSTRPAYFGAADVEVLQELAAIAGLAWRRLMAV